MLCVKYTNRIWLQKFNRQKITMGGCFARTRIEKYCEYFEGLHLGELNDLWSTVNIYKIKQIFQKHAHRETNSLDFDAFKVVMSGLQTYSNDSILKLFQVFDREDKSMVNFSNFLKGLSICTYGPEDTSLAIMFLMYDQLLEKKISTAEMHCLYRQNKLYLTQPEIYDKVEDFLQQFQTDAEKFVTVGNFITTCKSKHMFNIDEFKRVFSVFAEERLEKELASNFLQLNNLFKESENRYVSYVLDYKWFEAWKIYAEDHFKIRISDNPSIAKGKATSRKKNFKSKTQVNTLKTMKTLNNIDDPQLKCKTLNFVHSDIGSRPREVNNSVLEGEYEGILNTFHGGTNYILVSEKVWNYFHQIYEGGPAFRRTGPNQIEMQPKLIKIYSKMVNNRVDYSSELVRQVTSSITPFEIFTEFLEISEENMEKYVFYTKVIGGPWQKMADLDLTLQQSHSQVIIFFLYIPIEQQIAFISNHINVKCSLNTINIGDVVILTIDGEKKHVVFFGLNNQNKMILHHVGKNFKLDRCIDKSEFEKLVSLEETAQSQSKERERRESKVKPIGLKTNNSNSFLSSFLQILKDVPELASLLGGVNIVVDKENKPPEGKQLKENQKQPPKNSSIAGEISSLLKNINGNSKRVSSRTLRSAINIKIPKISDDYENFISSLMSQIHNELGQSPLLLQFKELMSIQVKTVTECDGCFNKTEKSQSMFSLVLPVPEDDQLIYKVTFIPYCQTLAPADMKKYAFKMKRTSTLSEYKKQIEQTLGLTNKNYLITEVYHRNIVKNYSTARDTESLEKLNLRDTDDIYVYELHVNFTSFVKSHYNINKEIDLDDIKVNSFIDCNNQDHGWIFGKVSSIEYLSYTKRTIVSVLHKINRSEEWKIGYDMFQVAAFPGNSYKNAEQFILRVNQRKYIESTNTMEMVGVPLVVTLAEWMRWKEFYYIVYLQMKRFFVDAGDDEEEDEYEMTKSMMKSTRTIAESTSKKTIKLEQKKKLNKFKEFLHSQQFPYKLSLVDLDGRCAICFRFVKDVVYKGEENTFCTGCKVSEKDPISWQVKCTETVICVDWKKNANFKTEEELTKHHPSLLNLMDESKANPMTLKACLDRFQSKVQEEVEETPCCHQQATISTTHTIENNPMYLFIVLDRLKKSQFVKRRIRKMIKYEEKLSGPKNTSYSLCAGIVNDEGTRFKGLIPVGKDGWCLHNGDWMDIINKKEAMDKHATVLLYKKG